VQYLLDNQDHLPAHNALSANGECAAMWCVTGKWCTLQGASILAVTSVGQAGGALLAGGILSNLTILVPMVSLDLYMIYSKFPHISLVLPCVVYDSLVFGVWQDGGGTFQQLLLIHFWCQHW